MQLFFRNAVFAFSNLAALINYSATFAVTFLLSLYLQYIQGLSPLAAGTVLVAQPVVMALGSPFAGRLSDRKEPQLIASAGMAITAASLAALAFLREGWPLSVIGLELALLGLGLALFSSPNTNAVMSSVEKRYYGLASATLGTMRLTGQMFSMAIATFVLSVFLGNVRIGPEHHLALLQSMRVLFAVFALLCTAGIIASLARGKVRPAR
jgi:MFS family permease